jgi:hypothetical protein
MKLTQEPNEDELKHLEEEEQNIMSLLPNKPQHRIRKFDKLRERIDAKRV